MLEHKWLLSIGDWSKDGHRECDNFMIQSNFTNKEAREAYFTAKDKFLDICPEEIGNHWCESPTKEECQLWLDAGLLDKELNAEEWEDELQYNTEEFANVVLKYIKLGDPEFEFKISEENQDTFHFYGYDEKERHISGFGYGLFY